MRTRQFGRLGAAAVIGLAVVTATGCSSSSGKAAAPTSSTTAAQAGSTGSYHGPTIVVNGTGEVKGTPDTVTISLGVQTIDPSAVNALNANNASAAALITTLKQKGVARRDMQTNNLSISPNFDKDGHITGYTVANGLTVTLHGVSGAGTVIDAAANAVGNAITFSGIELSISDTNSKSLIAQARAAAVKQAIAHAHQLADAAGMTLGAVRTIADTGNEVPQPQNFASGLSADQAAAVPLVAGQQQLSVDVAVTFAVSG